jgi:hypothetical protein
MNMGAYKGKANTIKDAEDKQDGFKKGGSTKVFSSAEKGEKRPMRRAGGGVFSAAAAGTPRGRQHNC